MISRLRLLLGASLIANILLFYGLYARTADTRDYYWRRMTTVTPTARPEPPTRVLREPMPSDPGFSFRRLEEARPAHAYAGQAGPAFVRWREAGLAAFAETLGYRPRPFGGDVRVTERTDFPTVTRHKVYLRAPNGLWLPAYLLSPKGPQQPRPAVLALPGHDLRPHGVGARAIAGYDHPENYMRSFGLRLAEAGYVVLAVDVPGIGELAYLGYSRLAREGLLVGRPSKTLMLEAAHVATDYLLSLPEVDARRVGAMGVSLGGELAGLSAALDQRLRWAIVSGFLCSYRDISHASVEATYVPAIMRTADIPDLMGMVAPRPLLIQMGRRDHHFKLPHMLPRFQAHFEHVASAYRGAGAPSAISLAMHDGGHVLDTDSALAWLKSHVPIRPDGERSDRR